MKNMKKALLLLAVAVIAVTAITATTSARVQKVMVIKINSTTYDPGTPFIVFPDPGPYTAVYSGTIIEVAEPAANVLVGNGDLLVSDVYGPDDPLPSKGDKVTVIQGVELDADGNFTPTTDPILMP